ncbi:hypothetical protein AOLI_G00276230 [Acnodon oligacanthus]
MCGRSTAAAEITEDVCKVQLIRPNATRLSPVEIAFLEEYARTMSPAPKILQAEIDVQKGWLLPTLTLLISKLGQIHITSRYCKPLGDALQEGLQQRFRDMLILVPQSTVQVIHDAHSMLQGCQPLLTLRQNATVRDGAAESEREREKLMKPVCSPFVNSVQKQK